MMMGKHDVSGTWSGIYDILFKCGHINYAPLLFSRNVFLVLVPFRAIKLTLFVQHNNNTQYVRTSHNDHASGRILPDSHPSLLLMRYRNHVWAVQQWGMCTTTICLFEFRI